MALLVCLLAGLLPGVVRAQEGTATRGVRLPLSFDGYDDEMGPRVPPRRAEWWRVYAARDGVPVYADRNGTKPASRPALSFLESFCVLTEDKVAKRLELCRSTSEVSSSALRVDETVGWVSTSDLILSSQPYRTQYLVSRKVFVVNDWREFSIAQREEFEALKVVARASPDTAGREINKVTGLDSRFSFVYRWDRPGNNRRWALLGTRRFIPDSRPQDCIVGWVPVNRLVEWNTRIALEPDPGRITPAHIYANQAGAQGAYAGETGRPLFQDRMVRTPAPPADWRYPMLGEVRSGDATALIGWLGGLSISGSATQVDPGPLQKVADRVRYRVSHVNVIFVIDATRSMGPYLQAVSRSSRDIMKRASEFKHTDLKVRFGAVVYRDMEDTPPIDQKALSPDFQDIYSFLDRQEEPNGGDADYPEALFAGIEAALTMAPAGETNVLFLIGDAGNNDEKGPISPRLAQLVKEKDPILQAIWLQRPPRVEEERSAIADFPLDLRTQILPLLEAQSDELRGKIQSVAPKVNFPARANLRETRPNIEDIAGAAANAAELLRNVITFDTEVLASLGGDLAGDLADVTDPGWAPVDQTPGAIGEESTPYMVDAEVLRELAREARNPEDFQFLVRQKVQLFQPGWVLINDARGRTVSRPVQLVSKQDLTDCRSQLLRLFEPGQSNREALQDAWQKLAENVPGEKPETPMEWIQLQYGIPFRDMSPFLSITYESIQTMSDEELGQMMNAARSAIDRLEAVERNEKIWFTMLDQWFAWIPLADMP